MPIFAIMVLFYRFATWLYFTAIKIAAAVSTKARQWVAGRCHIFSHMEADFRDKNRDESPVVWMHCASLGEFEQGRPVLEALKKSKPRIKILLTFFSPSGFEIRKDYVLADWVYYLPADTRHNARRFLELTRPTAAIFVKYEFWYFYLAQLKEYKIPTLLISANFQPYQPFFKWYGGLHRRMLDCFTTIFVQYEASQNLLKAVTNVPVYVAGDTRIDRILDISRERPPLPLIEKFCGDSPTLVCGSTWLKDEKLIAGAIGKGAFQGWKIIIAPHEVNEPHLVHLERQMGMGTVRYSTASQLPPEVLATRQVMVIDCIGLLSHLYRFARMAYIGGGCQNSGIHNTLEPAVYGIPLIFGNNYNRFPEAVFFVSHGGAYIVENKEDMLAVSRHLADAKNYESSAKITSSYLTSNAGATKEIIKVLEEVL